jgi:hypothetical protein
MSVVSWMKMSHWSLTLEEVVALEVEPVAVAVLLVPEELEQQEQEEHLWSVPVFEVLEWRSSCIETLALVSFMSMISPGPLNAGANLGFLPV